MVHQTRFKHRRVRQDRPSKSPRRALAPDPKKGERPRRAFVQKGRAARKVWQVMPGPDDLINMALSSARKARGQTGSPNRGWREKKQETLAFVKTAVFTFRERFENAEKSVPTFNELTGFEKEIWEASVDVPALQRALGQLAAARKIGKKIERANVQQIFRLQKDDSAGLEKIREQTAGRLASLLKSTKESIRVYNEARRTVMGFPAIDAESPCWLLAGVPNAGKSTLMKRLTGANVQIASYPFTTQALNVASFVHRYLKIQVIDTPGLLDRETGKRNPIEKKAIAALRHLPGALVFIVDPTQKGEQSLANQRHLFDEIVGEIRPKHVVVLLNKTDAATEDEKTEARRLFKIDVETGEGDACEWKHEVAAKTAK